MARECDGPDGVVRADCPLRCRLRFDGTTDGRSSAPGHVDWAGLPINLDLAFSRDQRDKVYVQHLMRRRGAQLWRAGSLCACDIAADRGLVYPDAAESVSGR